MKNGWQTSTLGEILAVLRNGVNCKQNKAGKGDRISRIESISDASFDLEKVGFAELSERDKQRYQLQRRDILFSHINSAVHVGKTAVFESDDPVYHGVNLLLMRPKDTVTPAFLEHALKYLFLSGYWRGVCKQSVNQASVNQQDISKVEFRYPKSLAEQRRIVGILDEAFDGIATAKANAEKNLQNARALFESQRDAVFTQRGDGWEEKPLGDIVEDISTGPFGSLLHKSDYENGGIPLVNPINIVGGIIIPDERKAVGKSKSQQLSRYSLRENDIVIGRRGEIGRCAVVEREQAGWLCGTGSFFIRPSDVTNSYYLAHLLRSRPYRHQLESVAGRAIMPSISNSDLANLIVRLPPLERQDRVLSLLDDLSRETQHLESIYQRKLAALDALKKSLLHRAFGGEL